jgi:hypothetical protein
MDQINQKLILNHSRLGKRGRQIQKVQKSKEHQQIASKAVRKIYNFILHQ